MVKGGSTMNLIRSNHFKPFFFRVIPQDTTGYMYLADNPPIASRAAGNEPHYYCAGSRMLTYYDGKMVWHFSAKNGYRDLMPPDAMFDRQFVSDMRPHINNDIVRPDKNCTLFTDGISYWFVDNVLIPRRSHRTKHRTMLSKMRETMKRRMSRSKRNSL